MAMGVLLAFVTLILCLHQVSSDINTNVESEVVYGGGTQWRLQAAGYFEKETASIPTRAPVPAPAPAPAPKTLDCGGKCKVRCGLHSRPNLCIRACGTCCLRCKCVPPGTSGNREVCGKCYTDMVTHGNKTKCP